MTSYRFIYKCRKCGEKDKRTGITCEPIEAQMLLIESVSGIEIKAVSKLRNTPIPMTEIHVCHSGLGVSDLIGVEESAQ